MLCSKRPWRKWHVFRKTNRKPSLRSSWMRSRPNAAGMSASPRRRINWALLCDRLAPKWRGATLFLMIPPAARSSDFPHNEELLEALRGVAPRGAAAGCSFLHTMARRSEPSQFAIQMREREARRLLGPRRHSLARAWIPRCRTRGGHFDVVLDRLACGLRQTHCGFM